MPTGDRWFFERFARPYALLMPGADADRLARGLAAAERPIRRVLDVAGGTGRAVAAVDAPERVVVDAASAMLREVPGDVAAVRGDASRLPVGTASVDAVLIVDAFHHLPRVDDVLVEARRVLRPGGVLVVVDFDRGTVRGRLLAGMERAVGFESTFYTAPELRDRLAGAGFDVRLEEPGFACTVVGLERGNQ